MADRVIQEEMRFPFEFISPAVIQIEETSTGVAIMTGTLLAEGISRNGHIYTVSEMKKLAKQAVGMPIFVGTMTKMDPNLGIRRKNMHANTRPNRVGKIIRAIFDTTLRKIKYWAELVNTKTHPKIIEEVKVGWGISIGGIATRAKVVIDQFGKLLTKIFGMKLSHIQLLSPSVIRGQDAAKVEGIEIQESMVFYEFQEPQIKIKKVAMNGITKVKITLKDKTT